MKPYRFLVTLLLLCVCLFRASAQCPVNVDFELGNFSNWQCYQGIVGDPGGVNTINLTTTAPLPAKHAIIAKGTSTDRYGNFLLSPPGNSKYSVKLGNDGTGYEAERISYQFTVPVSQQNFVINYQYAVVLQDGGHQPSSQPRFTAKVFDVTANSYITCGSFDYVATANLPGFKRVGSSDVFYKEWTAVSINLNGYQGHKLLLEFTTADCTQGGHFGYAYVDVSADCNSLIANAAYCPGATSVTLVGPGSFDQYKWYNADRSKVLGTGSTLTISPTPPSGTKVQLDLVPFSGFGCPYTAEATITENPLVIIKTTNPPPVCFPSTVDITLPAITAGTDANTTLSYWTDAACTTPLTNPKAVPVTGTYYVQATSNTTGCSSSAPVQVVVNALPVLQITDPATACYDGTVDITAPAIVAGSSANLTYSYWLDAAATQPLATPKQIPAAGAGTYYIKSVNSSGCVTIKPVKVTFYPTPVLTIVEPPQICFPATIDLTIPAVTAGSDNDFVYTYFEDAALTKPLANPDKVGVSGIYYIKAQNSKGCIISAPVKVTVHALPKLVINNPADLCYPAVADLTAASVTQGSTNVAVLSYWKDNLGLTPLAIPTAVADSGVYYIKAMSTAGCTVISPVLVVIHKLPVVKTTNPPKVYLPYTINLTKSTVTAGSSPQLTYTYWKDASATNPVADPTAIEEAGTYFIKGTNQYGCETITPVNVDIAMIPKILVPTAFTPGLATNNRLYPFLVGVKKLMSFKVYNRWGVLVFNTDNADPAKGWDGSFRGQIPFMETFTWYAEGYDYLGNVVHKSGNTVLLK